MSDDGPTPRPRPKPSHPSPGGALRRVLARARDGKTLDQAEAATLQRAGRPGIITYSRKVFVPLTRLCRDRCGYCTFATVPGRVASPYLSPDEVVDIAARGAALGCKEALFTLGHRPEDRWGPDPEGREPHRAER